MEKKQEPVPQEIYTEEYYSSGCDLHEEFKKSCGKELSGRLERAMKLADIKKGQNVLDAGCGRGELVFGTALKGANAYGFDYSKAAIRIAKKALENFPEKIKKRVSIRKENAKKLGYQDNFFDTIFFIDVIEHLHGWESQIVLEEMHRTLKPSGKIIVHTGWLKKRLGLGQRYSLAMKKILHPLLRVVFPMEAAFQEPPIEEILGKKGIEYEEMHVNEMNISELKEIFEKNNFSITVWEQNCLIAKRPFPWSILYNLFVYLWPLSGLPLIRSSFANELWAIAKPKGKNWP